MFPTRKKKSYIKRTLRMNAVRKGLLGGSLFWRVVWVSQLFLKGWSKASKRGEAPILFSEPLKEGDAWTIVHEPERSRRGRGEGRKMLVGPKRKAPRAGVMSGSALGWVGQRILDAPSAERINQILGVDVVTEPPPTRKAIRAAKKDAKKAANAAGKLVKAEATR
ncbi:MAG: hypothetical protein ACI81L_000075 [Verrucomicrobiales bacterium]|jgi:hypothetical protein